MRILLCDDHRLFLETLAVTLQARGHEVVLTTSPAEAVRRVETDDPALHVPDLYVTELRFPGGAGLVALEALRARHPTCRGVVLSGTIGPQDAEAAVAAGAVAVLCKDDPLDALLDAFDRIAAGVEPTPPVARPVSLPVAVHRRGGQGRLHRLLGDLTHRERQVLQCLIDAEDTVSIARSLGVAPSTARTHLQNVFLKLGVHNRLQAVALVAGPEGDAES
ncbi:two component transcriptional regulator, LuxR family [Geodermatophilus telluris]|uniref:Two component transcriptional regulator, LuxR family n=1 Tax=Geodermatophilus telluris TaxID=1190417 RepID=A0A1G6L5B4_9ACTN|nr:response regulator transcription factor [Geodermatophilus telluris]SDC38328.1 two component transcriptional regulator, LuxR family [Geodermatophilus telluris]